MWTLGLLAPEFPGATLEANLDAMLPAGAPAVQYDLACAVGETLPTAVDDRTIARIRDGFAARGLRLAALSGTYNMIDPDEGRRAAGLDGLRRVIEVAARLDCPLVTLCTGTRDPVDMWRRHPDNDRPEAFRDLAAALRAVAPAAEAAGVTLGVEPEVSNVIDSAAKARRLLDEVGSARLKIVMDGANVFHSGEVARMRAVLDESFALLGADIVLAHAKDLDRDGEAGHLAAGTGVLDYPYYLGLLARSGFRGDLVLHALTPEAAPGRVAWVRERIASLDPRPRGVSAAAGLSSGR
jgi:sugar phosphate isomerase/epimerase